MKWKTLVVKSKRVLPKIFKSSAFATEWGEIKVSQRTSGDTKQRRPEYRKKLLKILTATETICSFCRSFDGAEKMTGFFWAALSCLLTKNVWFSSIGSRKKWLLIFSRVFEFLAARKTLTLKNVFLC